MSQPRRPLAISLVERGWRGARECSLLLNARQIYVRHVVKGSLRPSVRAMIAPYPFIEICDVPRRWFPWYLWWMLLICMVWERPRWILVDNERTLKRLDWCRRWMRAMLVFVREIDGRYELYDTSGERRAFEVMFGG